MQVEALKVKADSEAVVCTSASAALISVILALQNIDPVMIEQYYIAIQILSHQPAKFGAFETAINHFRMSRTQNCFKTCLLNLVF